MATFGEIQKAIKVLQELNESGALRIGTEPSIIHDLKVSDIDFSELHGSMGIYIEVDISRILDTKNVSDYF